jgi:myo-inositol-1(or 4)-monophosphatase
MTSPNIDIDWLLDITRDAGALALSWFGRTKAELKADDSWVTEADLAVEKQLREAIGKVRPTDAILGEEGAKDLPDSDIIWAIDPVDGTRVFNHGLPVWCVSVGVLYKGTPTLGAIYLPVVGDMFHTDGERAFLNGEPLAQPDPSVEANSLLLASERTSHALNLDFPGRVLSQGSCAAHLCYVAQGSAVGAIDEAHLWDYAAAAAILRVLGIPFRYASGDPVIFTDLLDGRKVSESTIVCHPRHFDLLQNAYTHPHK